MAFNLGSIVSQLKQVKEGYTTVATLENEARKDDSKTHAETGAYDYTGDRFRRQNQKEQARHDRDDDDDRRPQNRGGRIVSSDRITYDDGRPVNSGTIARSGYGDEKLNLPETRRGLESIGLVVNGKPDPDGKLNELAATLKAQTGVNVVNLSTMATALNVYYADNPDMLKRLERNDPNAWLEAVSDIRAGGHAPSILNDRSAVASATPFIPPQPAAIPTQEYAPDPVIAARLNEIFATQQMDEKQKREYLANLVAAMQANGITVKEGQNALEPLSGYIKATNPTLAATLTNNQGTADLAADKEALNGQLKQFETSRAAGVAVGQAPAASAPKVKLSEEEVLAAIARDTTRGTGDGLDNVSRIKEDLNREFGTNFAINDDPNEKGFLTTLTEKVNQMNQTTLKEIRDGKTSINDKTVELVEADIERAKSEPKHAQGSQQHGTGQAHKIVDHYDRVTKTHKQIDVTNNPDLEAALIRQHQRMVTDLATASTHKNTEFLQAHQEAFYSQNGDKNKAEVEAEIAKRGKANGGKAAPAPDNHHVAKETKLHPITDASQLSSATPTTDHAPAGITSASPELFNTSKTAPAAPAPSADNHRIDASTKLNPITDASQLSSATPTTDHAPAGITSASPELFNAPKTAPAAAAPATDAPAQETKAPASPNPFGIDQATVASLRGAVLPEGTVVGVLPTNMQPQKSGAGISTFG